MSRVEATGLVKRYPGATRPAVDGFDLVLEAGALTTLVGPSGCGKSTVLRLIAGLSAADAGRIAVDGRPIDGLPPERRGAVLMGQDHRLFPHMTVGANVAFGLAMRGMGKAEAARRAAAMLDLVRLPDFSARRPAELSGGQARRVALARALVVEPAVLLLDEPLEGLDPELRREMQGFIRGTLRRTGTTALLVTHDRGEAVALGDRMAVMLAGRVAAAGTPDAVFERPPSRAVAAFFGAGLLLDARFRGRTAETAAGPLQLAVDPPAGAVAVMVRPEAMRLAAADGPDALAGRVATRLYRGTHVDLVVAVGGVEVALAVPVAEAAGVGPGDAVRVRVPPEAVHPLTA